MPCKQARVNLQVTCGGGAHPWGPALPRGLLKDPSFFLGPPPPPRVPRRPPRGPHPSCRGPLSWPPHPESPSPSHSLGVTPMTPLGLARKPRPPFPTSCLFMDSLRCGWPGWPAGSWRSLDGQVLLCDGPRSDLGPDRRLGFLIPLAGCPQPPPSRGHPPSESHPQTLVEPVPSLPEPGSLREPALQSPGCGCPAPHQCPVSSSLVLQRHRMWPVSRLWAVLRGEQLCPFLHSLRGSPGKGPGGSSWPGRASVGRCFRTGHPMSTGPGSLRAPSPAPHEHHPWLPTSTSRPPWPPLAALHCWVVSSAPV